MTKNSIIVTGGSKGIGAAIAIELDRRGYHVICVSRSGDAPAGEGIACDMTDEAAVRSMFAEAARKAGIVGLVNNAGVHMHGMIATLDTADYETVMRLNATAVMIASREAYPHLRGDGTIVNIGSFFDKLGVTDNFAYCASKAAVGAMTRCMAVEWARDNIRVLNVAPGYIATDLNKDFLASERTKAWLAKRVPMQRAGASEEVAGLVGAIFSERIGFLTGETIYLDGGQGMNH